MEFINYLIWILVFLIFWATWVLWGSAGSAEKKLPVRIQSYDLISINVAYAKQKGGEVRVYGTIRRSGGGSSEPPEGSVLGEIFDSQKRLIASQQMLLKRPDVRPKWRKNQPPTASFYGLFEGCESAAHVFVTAAPLSARAIPTVGAPGH